MYKKIVVLLIHTLIISSCIAGNHDDPQGTPSTSPHSMDMSVSEGVEKAVEGREIFEDQNGNYTIQISERVLPIIISNELREQIKNNSKVLGRFYDALERLKTTKTTPSKRVQGYYLLLNQGEVYVQTYLGRNAL